MIELSSPNCDEREQGVIDTLVLHYTGMKTAKEAIDRLCDREAKVSAHYVVDEDGTVVRLVEESARAWHAGRSSWRGRSGINDVSIGIEIVNPGHEFGYRPFPTAQMRAVAGLCREILSRHAIPARNVVAHSDVAPDRKEDPGELFDWPGLAKVGVGLWPDITTLKNAALARSGEAGDAVYKMQENLTKYGYFCPQGGDFDEQTEKTVIAFQRHFRPSDIGGVWDRECADRLQWLLDHCK